MISAVELGALLGLAVGAAMFLGCVLVFVVIQYQSKAVLSATQYFSSGILIAVIGQELLPDLKKAADGFEGSVAILTGFAAGVILMYGVEHISGSDEEPQLTSTDRMVQANSITTDPRLDRSANVAMPRSPYLSERVSETGGSHSIATPSWRRQSSPRRPAASNLIVASREQIGMAQLKNVPWGLTFPIYIDVLMDGMLIGLMSATSGHGAVMLAAATAVEMGFLGITFGALVMHTGFLKWVLAALLPLGLTASGVAGAASATALAPIFEVGITSFGIAALLFLACNELLKEATENMDGATSMWQSGWLFIGFLVIVMLERLFPEEVR